MSNTNIQQSYHNRIILLQNILDRMTATRGREGIYSLRGNVTLAERNAVVVALNELKLKYRSLCLGSSGEKEGAGNGQDRN